MANAEGFQEVRVTAQLQPGQSIRIVRGDYAGWAVYIDGSGDVARAMAAFAEVGALLEWIKATCERSARLPRPAERQS